MKTTAVPKEIWDEVFKEYTYTEVQRGVRPISRHLYQAYGNRFGGLSPQLWEKVFENLNHTDTRTGVAQTCTVFRGITRNTKSTTIRRTLFREYLPPNSAAVVVREASGIKTHPVFPSLTFEIGRHGSAGVGVDVRGRGGALQMLRENKVGRENATSPPVEKLVVALPKWGRSITLDGRKIAAKRKREEERPAFPHLWRAHKRMKAKMGDVSGGLERASVKENALAPSVAITVVGVVQGVFELLEKGLVKKDLKEAMVDFEVDEDTEIWQVLSDEAAFSAVESVKIQGGRYPKVRLEMGGLI
ncbi:hypothetical protein TWF481_010923 [Arthrobotrys musiformis]|uniref:Uncharacterized protein n=1 Tax=Arthrobotrys musiformis TaxID=47236 RepID=A0AAV9VYB2_9PEZI